MERTEQAVQIFWFCEHPSSQDKRTNADQAHKMGKNLQMIASIMNNSPKIVRQNTAKNTEANFAHINCNSSEPIPYMRSWLIQVALWNKWLVLSMGPLDYWESYFLMSPFLKDVTFMKLWKFSHHNHLFSHNIGWKGGSKSSKIWIEHSQPFQMHTYTYRTYIQYMYLPVLKGYFSTLTLLQFHIVGRRLNKVIWFRHSLTLKDFASATHNSKLSREFSRSRESTNWFQIHMLSSTKNHRLQLLPWSG